MKTITTNELFEMLSAKKGAVILNLITATIPKLKKNCPFLNVHKFNNMNVVINAIYEKNIELFLNIGYLAFTLTIMIMFCYMFNNVFIDVS